MRRRHDRLPLLTIAFSVAVFAAPPVRAQEPQFRGMPGELRQLYRPDLLPLYRTGSRVAQVSSYDTTGGNNDGFSGQYSFIRREGDALVLADLKGPGVVQRIWTPTPTERMVAFYFNGESTPRLRLRFIDLFSGEVEPFRKPIVGNEVGGYYSYLPIPYARSLKIVYEGQDIRFHQIQYRAYPAGTRIESFRPSLTPDENRELEAAAAAWSAPGRRPFDVAGVDSVELNFRIGPGGRGVIFRQDGGGRVVGIEISREIARAWGPQVLLEAQWDGDEAPAIRGPVDDLFGWAFGKPAARSLYVGSDGTHDWLYLPMPFDRSGTIAIHSLPTARVTVAGTARVFFTRDDRDSAREGRLYAAWRRETRPAEGQPYLLLDARGRGHYVGTLLQAQGLEPGMTTFFEGDDVVTIDGEMRMHGTGSEDAFNGGWYALLDRWDRGVSLPVHGSLDYDLPMSRTGAYRFFLGDRLSFEREIQLTIEHGPEGNKVPVDYTSVAYFYGDQPPLSTVDPAGFTELPVAPPVHVFYPQLLSVSLGGGTIADYSSGRYIEMRSERDGLMRVDVGAVPSGRYRVFLTYVCGPNSAAFSVWRRQAPVSEWINQFCEVDQEMEHADLGTVELTDQIRSLTIRTRASPGRGSFRLERLFLEEIR